MPLETVTFDEKFLSFWVPGLPAPGGSKRFLGLNKRGKAIITDDSLRNKHWRELVAIFAHPHAPKDLLRGSLKVTFEFVMPRPKYHYHTGKKAGVLRDNAPYYHTVKPDALKLARSTEDALTGVIWSDDAQTARLEIEKRYGDKPGCQVTVKLL